MAQVEEAIEAWVINEKLLVYASLYCTFAPFVYQSFYQY